MNESAIRIFVDADACPVKEEVYRIAERHAVSAGAIIPH